MLGDYIDFSTYIVKRYFENGRESIQIFMTIGKNEIYRVIKINMILKNI